MKLKLFLMLIFLALFASCKSSGKSDQISVDVPFEYYFEFRYVNADLIYEQSKLWVENIFGTEKRVILMDDENSGLILGIGMAETKLSGNASKHRFKYNFLIEVKTGKARLQFNKIEWQKHDSDESDIGALDSRSKEEYGSIELYFNSLAENYESSLKNKIGDWEFQF